MSLGEWLDTVLTEQGGDSDPDPHTGREQRRRGAALERIRDRTMASRGDDGYGRRANSRARRRDVEDYVPEPRFRQRSSHDRSRRDDYAEDRDDRRGRRRSRVDDVEVMLEDTLESVERSVAMAQRRTELALADLADLLHANETEHDAGQEAVAQLDDRLKKIEGRLNLAPAPVARLRSVSSQDQAPPLSDMQRLEAKLNTVLAAVTSKADKRADPRTPAAEHLIQKAVGEIAERQRELGEAGALGPLAARLQDRRSAMLAGRSETALALEQVQRDIAGLAGKLDEVKRDLIAPTARRPGEDALARMREEVAAISRLLTSSSLNPEAVARLQSQTEEIRNLLAATSAQPLPFERIEKEIAALTQRLERDATAIALDHTGRSSAAEIRSLIQETSEPALQDIRARIEALTGKVSEAIERTSGERHFSELSRRLDSVQQKIASVGAAPGDGELQSLAGMVGTLAETLEAARQPQATSAAIDQLQSQIGRLAERLDRSDSTFEAVSSLQKSVNELFAQLEARQRASEDARPSSRGSDPERASLDKAIVQEIAELRGLQDQADRRSHATLSAVHATLQKVVERLARLEDRPNDEPVETLSLGPAPVFTAASPKRPSAPSKPKSEGSFVANLLRSRAAPDEVPAPEPAPAEDILIEPGMAFPGPVAGTHPTRRPQIPPVDIGVEGDPTTGRANFIAAARRAAQSAQMEAQSLEPRRSSAKPGSAAKPRAPRGAIERRKRLIMLSLAALFVIAGAYAVMRNMSQPASHQTVSLATTPTKHEVQITSETPAAELSADTALLSPTPPVTSDALGSRLPAAGSDPTVVSSIPARAAPPPAAAAPPLLAAPAVNLRAQADAGIPSAQYELATRYAEGRLLPRDLKQSAQWYEKAALQGLAPAEYRLGSMYEKGLGVAHDLIRAKMWYQKAADQGNARAMHNLAVLIAEGTDNKPDYAGATVWFRKAAELGVRDSQYNLGILLARGLGQPVNLVQSYIWFAAAAAQGDDDAGKKRDDIAARLTAKELGAAKATADAFKPFPLDPVANEVATPPGGWDATAPTPAASGRTTKPKISVL